MQYKIADFAYLDKESIYIPFQGIQAEKQVDESGSKAYSAYSAIMYRQYGIWIQPFGDLVLDSNEKPVYFHVSNYIPYFVNKGYSVEVINGHHLIDYLWDIDEGTLVIVSVKDDGSQQISESIERQLQNLGITQLNKTYLRHSYLWVARKMNGSVYDIIYEEHSIEDLQWESILDEIKVSIKSGGALASNLSSIQLNDEEWSLNLRGLNMVTFSPLKGIQTITFDTFATLYAQGSLFKANPPKSKRELSEFVTISHAGGRLDGVDYTNCKEALEQSYTDRGHRVFQIDLELTLDEELVARRSWDSQCHPSLKKLMPDGVQEDTPPTYEQFKSMKILNRYTPLSVKDLLQFLIDHPNTYLITNTQHVLPAIIEKQFKKLVEAAAPFGYRILLRVIPQFYSEEMYEVIEKVFPFPKYIYTLYKTMASDDEVINFVKEKKIRCVAMLPERYNAAFGAKLKKNGSSIFIHTINDLSIVRKYLRKNVDGFYTDILLASEIEKERFGFQVELATRRKFLSEFLKVQFQIPGEEVQEVLRLLGLKELESIGERLFQAKTAEEVYSLFQHAVY
jgi:hypothetical protein